MHNLDHKELVFPLSENLLNIRKIINITIEKQAKDEFPEL